MKLESSTFVDKTFLGWVSVNDYHYIERIFKSIPPSKKQFNGTKLLYPKEPLRRYQEWTYEAIEAFISNGVLQTEEPIASSSAKASDWIWSEEYQNWYLDHDDGTFTWAQSEHRANSPWTYFPAKSFQSEPKPKDTRTPVGA